MSAWFYNKEIESPKRRLWKNYCLVGFELLLKSDHFTYGENKFWPQPFFSSKWTWVDNELRTAYLGIGVEFYLKGAYLKNGFSIQQINKQFIFPENIVKIDKNQLFRKQHITFYQMITGHNLNLIVDQKEIEKTRCGLLIVQDWRNTVLHSVRLTKTVSSKELCLVTDSVNALHNLLIRHEKQLISSIKRIAKPWLEDRYPDGKFMKTEPPSKRRKPMIPPSVEEIEKLLKKYDPDSRINPRPGPDNLV
ncbi:MAG: hypothetical protein FJZ10_01980 [Candidatus Omnitrophica bacterium]|nr:hypothetical protein [Candidatus Omnitrophota bacterium]